MAGDTPGRKPKLTKDLETRLLGLLRAGVPREVACRGAGLTSRSLRIWLSKARNGEARYIAFLEKVEEAEAQAQAAIIMQLRKHGNKHWQPLEWIMEFVYKYSSKTQIEMSGKVDGPLTPQAAHQIIAEKLGTNVLPKQLHNLQSEPRGSQDTSGDSGKPSGK